MKKLIEDIKKILKNVLDEYFCTKTPVPSVPEPSVPQKPEPTQTEIDAMPVSCLVLGLIKSIKENAQEWMVEGNYFGLFFHNLSKHGWRGYITFKFTYPYSYYDIKFNKKESLLLKEAIDIHQEKIAEERKKEREKQSKSYIKYFEDLGCPPSPSAAKKPARKSPKKKKEWA